jgi:hypothetical protein
MRDNSFRTACNSVSYRRGLIEVVGAIHPACVNLETWQVAAEWPDALDASSELPEHAIDANTELELTIAQARDLAAALLRAAELAESSANS